jgi:hypothetical protein
MALFFFLGASFSSFCLYVSFVRERDLLRSPTIGGGIALVLTGAIYSGTEVVRRFRRRPPHISLALGSLLVVATLFSGGLLVINGLQARKRASDTRILEELRTNGNTNNTF